MKKEFMIPKIETVFFSVEDIITTSTGGNGGGGNIPDQTLGNGGDIGLPFDPFSYD